MLTDHWLVVHQGSQILQSVLRLLSHMSPYHACAVDLSNAVCNAVRSYTSISHDESLSLDAILHLMAHCTGDVRPNFYSSTWRYHILLQYYNTSDVLSESIWCVIRKYYSMCPGDKAMIT